MVTMPETGLLRADVTDHAVLRYLERGHGLDISFFRRHISELCANGARFGASAVVVEDVKFVLVNGRVVTTVAPDAFVFPAVVKTSLLQELGAAALRDIKMKRMTNRHTEGGAK